MPVTRSRRIATLTRAAALVVAVLVNLLVSAWSFLWAFTVCIGEEDDDGPRHGSIQLAACSGGDALEIGFVYWVVAASVIGLAVLAAVAHRRPRPRTLLLVGLATGAATMVVPAVLDVLPG